MSMLTFPNFLSLLRGPLALLFLQENPLIRTCAILFAMATDFLDGYISRQYRQTSSVGTVLDPLMDKLFVLFVMIVLINEVQLTPLEAGAMFCRDFSVVIFGFYLLFTGNLVNYRFRSIWCGKITTTLQFFVLIALTNRIVLPTQVYTVFIVLGLLALVELYFVEKRRRETGWTG